MNEIKSLEQVSLVLAFLVPGLIILWIRAQFLTGRLAPHKDAILSYVTLSLIYHALTWPLWSSATFGEWNWAWLVLVFVGPAITGAFLGILATRDFPRNLLARIGIHLVHPMPTAWDWRFSRPSEGLVEVTFKDGTRISGWLDRNTSFASSTGRENDLYIGNVLYPDNDGNLISPQPARGIYVSAGEIKHIIFIETPKGAKYD